MHLCEHFKRSSGLPYVGFLSEVLENNTKNVQSQIERQQMFSSDQWSVVLIVFDYVSIINMYQDSVIIKIQKFDTKYKLAYKL